MRSVHTEQSPGEDDGMTASCKLRREASGEPRFTDTLILDSSLQKYKKIISKFFKSPSVWLFCYGSCSRLMKYSPQ